LDDILTTGTTLSETRRALSAVGWPVLAAAVIAATPHRGSPTPSSPEVQRVP
jgi:adenine/guanine phosphoribosyltransferase-like PRPP-binding protein